MTTEYLVCRTTRVIYEFIGYGNYNPDAVRNAGWDAPLLMDDVNSHPRIFSKRADAVAYCKMMNERMHEPDRITIDISGYSDYFIIPIQKGTSAETKGR